MSREGFASTPISVVVPLFNHLAETQAMLASLQASLAGRADWELVLVDDGSTDGTLEWLDTLRLPRLTVVRNAGNLGFAHANNRAIAQCRGEVLVLANNDVLFDPGWLQPMLDVLLDPARQAGLVGNVQTRVTDGAVDHTGIDLNFRGQLEHIRISPGQEGVSGAVERFAVTAACVAMRRDVFLAVGGFDEAYMNGCEDVDLCFKLAAAGWRNWVALDSVVRHHVSLSRGTANGNDDHNSALLCARWHEHLQRRLASRYLVWLRHGVAAEPSTGCEDVVEPDTTGRHGLDAAEAVARSVLQREQCHRDQSLGRPRSPPTYAGLRCLGGLVPSALAGYAHPEGDVVFELPAGVGLQGLFVLGQVVGASDSAPWHLTLAFNGVQRLRYTLGGHDFNVGTHRPLVWSDRPSRLILRFEAPVGLPKGVGRIYIRCLVADGHVQLPASMWVPHADRPDTQAVPAAERSALSPEAYVQHAYWALLGRAADPSGFEAYTARLRDGLSREALWTALSESAAATETPHEPRPSVMAQAEQNALPRLLQADGLSFVAQAYTLFFGRLPDPEGAQHYLGLLQDGWSKWYLLGLLWRAEERVRHAPVVPGVQEGLERYAKAQQRTVCGWYWRRVRGADSDFPADRHRRAQQWARSMGPGAADPVGRALVSALGTPAPGARAWARVHALAPDGNALAPEWAGRTFDAAVSLGGFCHTAAVLRRLDMRSCSGPFDWVFMSPAAVLHALQDRFQTFLDPSQYEVVADADKVDPQANLCDHRYYRQRFGVRFVFNHHNPTQARDAAYFLRCVRRFEAQMAAAAPAAGGQGGNAGAAYLLVMMTYEAVTTDQLQGLLQALGSAASGCFLLVLRLRVVRDPALAPHITGAYLPVDVGRGHALLELCVRAPSDGLVFPHPEDNQALAHLLNAFRVRRHGRAATR